MYNYLTNVKILCDEWTAKGKEFSAFDVTKELRKRNNVSAILHNIYHSIVRNEVHNYLSSVSSYDKRNSDCGAYTVYFPKVIQPIVNPVSLSPTFGSFPTAMPTNQVASKKVSLQSISLKKGQNGKFTVPQSIVNPNKTPLHQLSPITVKFMKDGRVFSKKTYEVDKSNNVRFRYPADNVTVQQTSNPTILIAKV